MSIVRKCICNLLIIKKYKVSFFLHNVDRGVFRFAILGSEKGEGTPLKHAQFLPIKHAQFLTSNSSKRIAMYSVWSCCLLLYTLLGDPFNMRPQAIVF